MRGVVTITNLSSFDDAFGDLGLKVGPRTGLNKRTQAEKEWYVIRQFLKFSLQAEKFHLPLVVSKQPPPAPDFSLTHGDITMMLEITEATSIADQRDMTLSEARDDSSLLGEDGGRFSDGIAGDHLERVWINDIVRAIRRKRKKSILVRAESHRHLLIYPNFPALIALNEQEAIDMLRSAIARNGASLRRAANGCQVHILAENSILFDILGGQFNHRPKSSVAP